MFLLEVNRSVVFRFDWDKLDYGNNMGGRNCNSAAMVYYPRLLTRCRDTHSSLVETEHGALA